MPEGVAAAIQRLHPGSCGTDHRHGTVTQPAVEDTLATLRNSSWEQVKPVGDGEEYRVKSENRTQASALAFGDSLVHGSLLTGA